MTCAPPACARVRAEVSVIPVPETRAPAACACLSAAVTVIVVPPNLLTEATTAISELSPSSIVMLWPSRKPITFATGTTVAPMSVPVAIENLKRVRAWVPIDGTYDLGPGPRISQEEQEQAYPMSRCMSCCLCMEVCPQFTVATGFVVAAIINQVRLFNQHPTGASLQRERLESMTGEGGIHECSYAQNCVRICPKNIPLTQSISNVYGQVMKQTIVDLFRK